jgi:hypothetical protein
MAQINIEILVDGKELIQSNTTGHIDKKYVIVTDDQTDDVYVDEDISHLITRVQQGDVLIWTIKTRSGISVYFEEIIINDKKKWFVEEGGKPVIDPSKTKITGTISKDIKSGDVCSYILSFSLEQNLNSLWNFDPLIEARTHTS